MRNTSKHYWRRTISATMGRKMVAVGMMPANVDDMVPMTVSSNSTTDCGRTESDDSRWLMSDDRPDVFTQYHKMALNRAHTAAKAVDVIVSVNNKRLLAHCERLDFIHIYSLQK